MDPNANIEPSTGNTVPIDTAAPVVVESEAKPEASAHAGNDVSPISAEKKDSESSSHIASSSDEQYVATANPSNKPSCCARFFHTFIPITEWLPKYKKEYFSFDLIAGLTVGIMAIPQGMAYAMLAELPPIYGLYACIVPVFVYGILGTSRHVHIGPFALVSMMVASALSYINPATDLPDYIKAMTTLSLCCGIIFLLLGVCKGGVVARLLSETIVTAFTAASAFNIGGSQLKHLWGVSCKESVFLKIVIKLFFTDLRNQFNWWAFLIGASATVILYAMKKLNKKYLPKKPLPVELFLVILYILVMWAFDLKHRWHLKYLGDYDIVRGMPPLTIPDMKNLDKLVPSAVMICVVDYVITLSLGKIFARQFGYPLDPNQELVALGGANIVGAFFSCYPPAGSLSRSALVANCEARTSLHNFISPLLIIICLYLLTGVIIYIPNASLAAIVIVNLFSLFAKFAELAPLWRTSWADFGCFLVCAACTITLGTEAGLIGGVASSWVFLLVACLLNRPKEKKEVESISKDGWVVVPCSWSLHFINRDSYRKQIDAAPKEKTVIFDLRRVTYIDCSAIMMLQELAKQHNADHEQLFYLASTDMIQSKLIAYGDTKLHVYTSLNELLAKQSA